jgi:hypothetical protein
VKGLDMLDRESGVLVQELLEATLASGLLKAPVPVRCVALSQEASASALDALLQRLLNEHGDRRRAARATDRRELSEIAKLVPVAIRAGISKHEIARLTGVSRPWINELLSRSSDDA